MEIEQKVILTRTELEDLLTSAWEYGCRYHADKTEKSRNVSLLLSMVMGEK